MKDDKYKKIIEDIPPKNYFPNEQPVMCIYGPPWMLNGENPPQEGMMKIMNWMMPILMGVFALFYSAAFCIYMFTNSLITVLFNVIYNVIAKKLDAKEEDRRLSRTFK